MFSRALQMSLGIPRHSDFKRRCSQLTHALFFDPDGTLLNVKSKYDKFKHFFSNDEELGAAMAMALDESKAAREL